MALTYLWTEIDIYGIYTFYLTLCKQRWKVIYVYLIVFVSSYRNGRLHVICIYFHGSLWTASLQFPVLWVQPYDLCWHQVIAWGLLACMVVATFHNGGYLIVSHAGLQSFFSPPDVTTSSKFQSVLLILSETTFLSELCGCKVIWVVKCDGVQYLLWSGLPHWVLH